MTILNEQSAAIIVRAKIAFGVDSDNQLAKAIGLGRSSITSARDRNTIPFKNLIGTILEKDMDISLDVLFNHNQPSSASDQ